MARRLADPGTLAAALSSRCLAVWGPDHIEEQSSLAAEIVGLGAELGDRQLLFFGQQYAFVSGFALGQPVAARLDALERLAEELRQPLPRWGARRYRAMLALFAGNLDDAERLALEALAIGQSAQEPDAMSVFATQVAVIRFEQGRLAELETALEGFAEQYSELPAWVAAVGLVKAELGREAEAQNVLDALADEFASIPRNVAWLAAMAMLAQLCAYCRDARRAATLSELLSPFAGRNALTGDRQAWGSTCRYLGLLAYTQGRLDSARHWLERAVEENLRWGSAAWAAYAQCELAETLVAGGAPSDGPQAEELAAAAAATAGRLGMVRLRAAAEQAKGRATDRQVGLPGARLVTMRPWTPELSRLASRP